MREYEAMIISKPDLPESELNKMMTRWESIIGSDGGQIIRKEPWGVRKLATPIKKIGRGSFVVYDLAGSTASVKELERVLKFDENVLRCMVIKLADHVDVEQRKIELQREAEAAAQRAAEAARERAETDTFAARRGGGSSEE